MPVKRYVTTDKASKHRDPRDETGKRLSQVARIRRLEALNRELEKHNGDLTTEIHDLRTQIGELKDVLVDFCSTFADKTKRGRSKGTTKLIKRIDALTDSHTCDTRTFLPDDAPDT